MVAVTDLGGANSRFLGLVSVWGARSFDQTALRPSVIKIIRQIDVKYITHNTSFGVTCVKTHVWAAEVDSPLNSYLYVHWILDFKQLLLLLTAKYVIWPTRIRTVVPKPGTAIPRGTASGCHRLIFVESHA